MISLEGHPVVLHHERLALRLVEGAHLGAGTLLDEQEQVVIKPKVSDQRLLIRLMIKRSKVQIPVILGIYSYLVYHLIYYTIISPAY